MDIFHVYNFIGQLWIQVHPPNSSTKLRMITVGDANHVWALDTSDRLYMRQETASPAFPEVQFQTLKREYTNSN